MKKLLLGLILFISLMLFFQVLAAPTHAATPPSCTTALNGTCKTSCPAGTQLAGPGGSDCGTFTPYCCKAAPSCNSLGGTCQTGCTSGNQLAGPGQSDCGVTTPYCCKTAPSCNGLGGTCLSNCGSATQLGGPGQTDCGTFTPYCCKAAPSCTGTFGGTCLANCANSSDILASPGQSDCGVTTPYCCKNPNASGTPPTGGGTSVNAGCAPGQVWTLDCVFPLTANVIYWSLIFGGIVALIFIIIGGIRLLLSGGNPKSVDSGRKTVVFAILGLALIFLAFLILNLIGQITGVACIKPSAPLTFTRCNGFGGGGQF